MYTEPEDRPLKQKQRLSKAKVSKVYWYVRTYKQCGIIFGLMYEYVCVTIINVTYT